MAISNHPLQLLWKSLATQSPSGWYLASSLDKIDFLEFCFLITLRAVPWLQATSTTAEELLKQLKTLSMFSFSFLLFQKHSYSNERFHLINIFSLTSTSFIPRRLIIDTRIIIANMVILNSFLDWNHIKHQDLKASNHSDTTAVIKV